MSAGRSTPLRDSLHIRNGVLFQLAERLPHGHCLPDGAFFSAVCTDLKADPRLHGVEKRRQRRARKGIFPCGTADQDPSGLTQANDGLQGVLVGQIQNGLPDQRPAIVRRDGLTGHGDKAQ